MNKVTDTILLFSLCNEEHVVLAVINESFAAQGCGEFVHIEGGVSAHWCGGTQFLQANVAVGAFNYLDLPSLVKGIRALKEQLALLGCDYVQLIVQCEDDWGFRLINVIKPEEL